MKSLIILSLLICGIQTVNAQPKSRAEKQLGVKLGTDFKFNPLSVNGKYQSPTEGLVVVENEKLIGDILDYRKSYKDRIAATKKYEVQK